MITRPFHIAATRGEARTRRAAAIYSGLGAVLAGITIGQFWGPAPARADQAASQPSRAAPVRTVPGPAARATASAPRPTTAGAGEGSSERKTVAVVNGEMISREELAQECLRHYGTEVLESLVNKYLIMQECQRRNITISPEEVDAEVERMAKRFGLPLEQWLKLLKQERGIKPAQYANDIIWPTLALRRLAGERLQVSQEELTAEFETQYGPAVRARMIVSDDLREARDLRSAAAAHPEDFGNLAKDHSKDLNSASAKGLTQPIRRHTGHEGIEQVAFTIKDGDISDVIQVGRQYVILKREGLMPAADVKLEQVKPQLEELIRDRKMRGVANDIFRQLQDGAQVQNVLNDPLQRKQTPGAAALINGHQITVRELAEACIERHGEEVLEGTINRRLIEQACKKAKITISEKELDQEIARAAATMVKPKADGSPDVETWLNTVTQQQGVSVEVYRRDSVWPSVALKKLVGNKAVVSEEDLRKGFEANYGPRVRCRAIVLGNPRQAQKVWELARQNLNAEYFGELAAQYSVEASSRALQGVVPPIKKHGGQPILEKEAFAMKPGELSSIIQAGDKFVILFCEGITEPVQVDPASVRDLLYEDIYEKKLRLAMAEYFEQLQGSATIDNFLAGTSKSPKKPDDAKIPAGVPTLREVSPRG